MIIKAIAHNHAHNLYTDTCTHCYIQLHRNIGIHTYLHSYTFIQRKYINSYIHAFINIFSHTYNHNMHIHLLIYTYIHRTYAHTYRHVYTFYVDTHRQTSILALIPFHTKKNTYIHTYIHRIYAHIQTHAYVQTQFVHTLPHIHTPILLYMYNV